MIDFWTWVRFLHLVAAAVWVGGQLVFSMILRPAAAATLEEDPRREFFIAAGRRFARISLVALAPILLATGIGLTYHRGVRLQSFLINNYAMTLGWKIGLAAVSFALAAAHGWAATRAGARAVRIVGISGALVALGVVILAAALVP